MNRKFALARLIIAIISTSLEEVAIWAIWRWLLPEFNINLAIAGLIVIMVVWAAFSIWLFIFTTRTLKKQAAVGLPSMTGTAGKAASRLEPEGMVRIRGELWGAVSLNGTIEVGKKIIVERQEGLKLFVRKI
jgi:membrane-bound ClpP family serine protease